MSENDLGDRMMLGLPFSTTNVDVDTPKTNTDGNDVGSQVVALSSSDVAVPLPQDAPIPVPTDPAEIETDIDSIKTKVSPDEVVAGMHYVMKRMVFKDKRQARDIVVQCLKHDPKYFSSLRMMGIEDDSGDFLDRLMVREGQALTGGVGDNLAPTRIDPAELEMGVRVEMEHTNDLNIAREIATDHLAENPRYYTALKTSGMAPELNTTAPTTTSPLEIDVVEPMTHFFETSVPKKTLLEVDFWGKAGAGALIFCASTKRFLVALRSDAVREPNTWGIWGGAIDPNELPEHAVRRELEEETGYTGQVQLLPLVIYKEGTFKYHNYLATVPAEFTPRLNWETDDFKWVKLNEFPAPLHFGLVFLLKHSHDILSKISTEV